ncbi:hypothetical protein MUCCIDRAFT_109263 [Mucor lusitanicus CBS 277.49]|uniref:Uncharacterized protein n=1 Tax=Mucor lusitanicus CBS 277.49 TaxID=747725 RepID=A0A168MUY9_MUCCL|nr:hypothetical protein MUCCIDRAFT_109263 [Mucor lusitanicus CBS 277.49]
MAAPATTDSPAATTTSDKSFAAVTATPTYDTEGLPASIFPVLTGYPDEYESTTELDDGILYLSEQDEDLISLVSTSFSNTEEEEVSTKPIEV